MASDADGKPYTGADVFATGMSIILTGGFVNPTPTGIALALQLADHLGDVLLSFSDRSEPAL